MISTSAGTGIAFAIFAWLGPKFYRSMDRLEARIRRDWPDSWYKRIILFKVGPCPNAEESEIRR
jgi:hypothetical protein